MSVVSGTVVVVGQVNGPIVQDDRVTSSNVVIAADAIDSVDRGTVGGVISNRGIHVSLVELMMNAPIGAQARIVPPGLESGTSCGR